MSLLTGLSTSTSKCTAHSINPPGVGAAVGRGVGEGSGDELLDVAGSTSGTTFAGDGVGDVAGTGVGDSDGAGVAEATGAAASKRQTLYMVWFAAW